MKILLLMGLVMGLQALLVSCSAGFGADKAKSPDEIKLPPPNKSGKMSLEETLSLRRSVRQFKPDALTPELLGQILWAGDGLSAAVNVRANRTAPSAGALYPMEIYAVTAEGIYHYLPVTHTLKLISAGDHRTDLAEAALNQPCVKGAALDVVITGNTQKCAKKYGDRAQRYVDIEAGHIAENIHLQAVALNLGSVPVGAFEDDKVAECLQIPKDETPLYIIPVGYPAK